MKVFQSIIYYVEKDSEGQVKSSEIIQDVKTHIIENQEKLQRQLIRAIPEKYEDKLDDIMIVIRPF